LSCCRKSWLSSLFMKKRPHPLLLADSWIARGKMTKSGTPNCLNYWWNFNSIYIIYVCFRGTHNTTWLAACGLRAAGWRHMSRSFYMRHALRPQLRGHQRKINWIWCLCDCASCNNNNFINNFNQLNMFRAIISSIFRSTRLCLQLAV